MKKYLLAVFFIIGFSAFVLATHNRAGEITYEHISGRTYKITLITYTYTPSAANETRKILEIDWGDGSTDDEKDSIERIKIDYLPNEIQRNTYVGYHTFPGDGIYEMVMSDPNRNLGIENIPSSVNVVFTLKTILLIKGFIGNNTAPKLFNPPVDKAFLGHKFVHNPMAYDIDGDSLSYKLVKCLGADGEEIPGYRYPESSNTDIYIDAITGDLVWDAPVLVGEYNVAFTIEEYRDGVKIGEILRDLQIEVYETDEKEPEFEELQDEICVIAGNSIEFDVVATNPNGGNLVLTGIGGILDVTATKASFQNKEGEGTVKSTFIWKTSCSDIRVYPYSVSFKAEIPSEQGSTIKLVKYKTVMIRVIAPKPENLVSESTNKDVQLNWDHCPCPGVYEYLVYRKIGSSDYEPEPCTTGLPESSGYKLVGSVSKTEFLDNNGGIGLWQGLIYCYRIVGVYGDGALSMPSDEICEALIKSRAIITHVDVDKTSETEGEIIVKWIVPEEFDKEKYPGPYRYKIFRTDFLEGGILSVVGTLEGLDNMQYIDRNINTQSEVHSYTNSFYNIETDGTEQLIGSSDQASQVELNIVPGGFKLNLEFQSVTPWLIDSTIIYKQNKETLYFEAVDTVAGNSYFDTGLENEVEYCYYVETYGHYMDEDIIKPLVNRSPIVCAIPMDDIPPCSPDVQARSECIESYNFLRWNNPNNTCTDDVVEYRIYYRINDEANWELIHTTRELEDTTFRHDISGKLRGCYAVTAIDLADNESEKINYCVDMCLQYELPNIFTPDADNINDLYVPMRNVDVEKIDMTIFNRWGNIVYETDEPEINWDGRDQKTKEMVSEGVYYYVCDVYEERSTGVEIRNISGFIHVMRKEKKNE